MNMSLCSVKVKGRACGHFEHKLSQYMSFRLLLLLPDISAIFDQSLSVRGPYNTNQCSDSVCTCKSEMTSFYLCVYDRSFIAVTGSFCRV